MINTRRRKDNQLIIKMSIITLNNMEFHAYHGCLKHERELGNTFIVTVSMKLDTAQAGMSDKLQDTLNYQQVYDIVSEQMRRPVNLIEHEAQKILDALTARFPEVELFTVRLSKLNPPLGGKVADVTIEVSGTGCLPENDDTPLFF